MPSLFRFLLILAVLAGLAYAGMTALVANVKVEPREMTQTVNLSKAPP
ncbi:MAG: histidine kinase [Roseiarcus sp.]